MSRRLALISLLGMSVLAPRGPLVRADDSKTVVPQVAANTPGRIVLKITGLRSSRGQVFVALWRNDKKFPGTPPPGTPNRTVKVVDKAAETRFDDVPPGEFAITVFHDEDGDGELKTNFIGIPREGIGFSRDARARIGAPDYDDAKLTLRPGQTEKLKITMWYI